HRRPRSSRTRFATTTAATRSRLAATTAATRSQCRSCPWLRPRRFATPRYWDLPHRCGRSHGQLLHGHRLRDAPRHPMSHAPDQPIGDLSERALAQRERVLCAAEQCFLRRVFHAASIADIAATAEMSAGLIYRYF